MKLINTKLALAVSLAISLSACSPNMTTDKYLAQAKIFSEKRDHNSAIIALKNAVRIEPQNSNVRFALGAAYLAQGDYLAAEKELEKAENLGSGNKQLLTYLVQAKVKLNKFDYVYQLIEQVDAFSNVDQVMLLTYAGIAAIHQNKTQLAKEYIEDAISISEDSMYGQIGKAYISHSGNNYQDGLNTVDELLSTTPNFAEALMLKGYLLQATEQFEQAANTFEQYSTLRPKDISARFFVAQNYVLAQKFDAAEPQVDLLLKISEFHPLANQLKAEIEYAKGNLKQAKEYAVISFQQNDSFTLSKIIAGISAYKLKDFEQSYQYLISVENILPAKNLVRKIIIDLQLKLGYNTDAISGLKTLIDVDEANPEMLTMASNQMLAIGNIEAAQELLQASIELDTSEPSELAKQGITQLRLNQADKGIAILEKALNLDPNLAFAEQGLAIGYLNNSQFTEAIEIAKKWQKSGNQQIQGYLLESAVLDRQQKSLEAKLLLDKILTLDSHNIPALYKLAVYAHKEKNIEQAYDYYTQVLKLQPQNIRSIVNFTRFIALAVEDNDEYTNKAITFYQARLNDKPNNNFIKLGFAYIYRLAHSYDLSIELLQEIAKSAEPLEGINIALGETYNEMGDWQQAIETYKEFVNANPKNLKMAHKIFSLYEQHSQVDKALVLLEKTIRFHQENVGLLLLKSYYQSLLKIEPNQNDLDKIKENKITAEHWLLDKVLGNIAYTSKNFESSAKHYKRAYKKQANEINVINWSKSVALQGDKKQAVVILEQYIQGVVEEQRTISINAVLADAYMNSNELSQALTLYEIILSQQPENLSALNNLSYLELQRGNAKISLTYAERAYELAKNNAAIIDTYAQALTANEQFTLAIEKYDKALGISGNNIKIATHKAAALKLMARENKKMRLLRGRS
ncbi:MAG: PEP-CTERM system TPR-repeat protein PrsT [Colwellia sp.]|nr:PEP-CTERM system TPR-repeat protein PrsT [Colwellia sp.]